MSARVAVYVGLTKTRADRPVFAGESSEAVRKYRPALACQLPGASSAAHRHAANVSRAANPVKPHACVTSFARRFAGVSLCRVADPSGYAEILKRGYALGRDFRVAFGDSKIELCLLVAPHGGGIEPGSSEIMRAVADLGGWAWYEFAGFLRQRNKECLHIPSTHFDEPTLQSMLPHAGFVVAFHGASKSREPVVYVGVSGMRGVNWSWNRSTAHSSDTIYAPEMRLKKES